MTPARSRIQKSPGAYRTIGEVSAELGLAPHVLRYWVSRFPEHVAPTQRPGGRRLFSPSDIAALSAVRLLVHEQGMTLNAARALLSGQGAGAVLRGEAVLDLPPALPPGRVPARALQVTLACAFGAGSRQDRYHQLAGALASLEDVKSRLDALRQSRVLPQ